MEGELAHLHAWPRLHRPVLVVALEGWIDAGLAATNAMGCLLVTLNAQLMATFDADALIDHRARRPVLRVTDGVDAELRWPAIELRVAEVDGRSLLLLTGQEPDFRWHQFVKEVVGLASRLHVELVVGLGSFPAPVPHTRPVRLVASSPSQELAAQVGYFSGSVEVPAGTQSALEHAFGQAGVQAVGLWARVPHYASAMPYPAASVALLEELSRLCEVKLGPGGLLQSAEQTKVQIDQLIASNEEHQAMVRQLEESLDRQDNEAGMDLQNLPSGEEIAAELERFLRGEGPL